MTRTYSSREELDANLSKVLGALTEFEAVVVRELDGAPRRLNAELLEPLKATVQKAAETHSEVFSKYLQASDSADSDFSDRAEKYRKAVTASVLKPCEEFFEATRPGETIGATYENAVAKLNDVVDEASSSTVLPEAQDLYSAKSGDSIVTVLGKLGIRTRRGLTGSVATLSNVVGGVFGRAPRAIPPATRTVPLASLMAYHTHVRINPAFADSHEQYQQNIGLLTSKVEDAFTEWTHGTLEARWLLDRPGLRPPHPFAPPDVPSVQASERSEAEESHQDPEKPKDEDVPPDPAAEFATLVEHGRNLQTRLELVLQFEHELMETTDALAESFETLKKDLDTAGTFMLSDRKRVLNNQTNGRNVFRERTDLWAEWHKQCRDKLALLVQVILLQQELSRIEDELLDSVARTTLDPIISTFDRLKGVLQHCAEEARQINSTTSSPEKASQYRTLGEKTSRDMKGILDDIPGIVTSDRALASPGTRQWARLQELIEELPESFSIHSQKEDPSTPITPEKTPLIIRLRDVTKVALDPPFPDQLRNSAAPLRQRIPSVWAETEQILHIIQYNFDAYADELESEEGEENATELVNDGIRRSEETLDELTESLREPWDTFASSVFDTFEEDWADLHRRVRSRAVLEEKLVGIRTRIDREIETGWRTAKLWGTRRFEIGRRWAFRGRTVAERLIQRGRTAVSTTGAGEQEAHEALESIVAIDAIVDELPLVYRRLFSFGALREPSLFTGRDKNVENIKAHFSAWLTGGNAGVAVLAGSPGSGRTSLLNVLPSAVFEDADVRSLPLVTRIRDETEFASLLAEALEIELHQAGGLDQLADELLARRGKKKPLVCLVDNIEHLVLRAPAGLELFERVLAFFSRTDVEIFWLSTITAAAWKFVETTAPAAAASVTVTSYEKLDRPTLERLVITRHERSGMPLTFAPPQDPSPLLRRRLEKASDPEKRENILRENFFDQLHKLCGSSVKLAFFYWIQSADFGVKPDTLTVNPIDPVDFRFLNSLDLQQAFSLHAFVMHNTLTLQDHNRILAVSESTGRMTLESLVRLKLLTTVTTNDRGDAQETAEVTISTNDEYSIRRLALYPVFELLKQRNILK